MENKHYFVNAILMLIGAVCFGIVTYGNFYRNNILMGSLCLIATLCDLISFIMNLIKYRSGKTDTQ